MDIVKLNRNEWDAFLSELSEFAKRYELVLGRLDLVQTQIDGVREKTKQQAARSSKALSQVGRAIEKLCEDTEEILNESERSRS